MSAPKKLEGEGSAYNRRHPFLRSGRSKIFAPIALIGGAALVLLSITVGAQDASAAGGPSATAVAVQQSNLSVTVTVTGSGYVPRGGSQLRLTDLPRVYGTGYNGCQADSKGDINCSINTGAPYTSSTIRYEFDDLSGNLTSGPFTVNVQPYNAPPPACVQTASATYDGSVLHVSGVLCADGHATTYTTPTTCDGTLANCLPQTAYADVAVPAGDYTAGKDFALASPTCGYYQWDFYTGAEQTTVTSNTANYISGTIVNTGKDCGPTTPPTSPAPPTSSAPAPPTTSAPAPPTSSAPAPPTHSKSQPAPPTVTKTKTAINTKTVTAPPAPASSVYTPGSGGTGDTLASTGGPNKLLLELGIALLAGGFVMLATSRRQRGARQK